MSTPRSACFDLILGCLLISHACGAVADPRAGLLPVDYFPSRTIGATAQTGAFAQDHLGRLFVGSDTLLVFNGTTWSSHAIPGSHDIFALAIGADGQLFAGGYNQIGYFSETQTGQFEFHSLVDKLPEEHRRFESPWSCDTVEGITYFICQSKVLRWDGQAFQVWSYPTTSRLFPVRLGHELWFTHRESGLYRLTAIGPELHTAASGLPPRPAFGLLPDPTGLRLVTGNGIFLAGQPDHVLCSPAVVEFLRPRPLSSFQILPDGNFALGTLGGLGIVSPDGQLLQVFTQENGLTSNAIFALFLDRQDKLWIGQASGGVTRLDPHFSVSLFKQWGAADHADIHRLIEHQGTVFAATDAGLFRFEKSAAGPNHFQPVIAVPLLCTDLLPTGQGLLLCSFGGLDLFDGQAVHPLVREQSRVFRCPQPSARDPASFYCLINQDITRFTSDGSGQWQPHVLGHLPELADQAYADAFDHLWFSSTTSGLWHFDPDTARLTNLHHGPANRPAGDSTYLAGTGPYVVFFDSGAAYLADTRTNLIRPLPSFPTLLVRQCTPAPDGRSVYVLFTRKNTSGTEPGLGQLTLPDASTADRWTEWSVPKLESAGLPNTLLATHEAGADVLWIGGNEGVIRLHPGELTPLHLPAAPWLRVTRQNSATRTRKDGPVYPNAGLHFSLRVGTPEIDDLPGVQFQSRLSPGAEEWSAPSPRTTFDFSNLADGPHTFEVRAINAAGLASAPATSAFVIAPPWYRQPGAYAGFAAGLVLAGYGFLRYHDRRIRRHNQALEALVRARTAELEQANAAKDEFLAGISHEIRNPMNGVIGIASAIDASGLDATSRQHLEQLRLCADHLSCLLEDLLDFSRLQSGRIELHPRPFDLSETVGALTALTAAESTRTGLPVEIAISPAVPRRLVGDATRIRQILLNYVINALRYAGRGQVTLTVWLRQKATAQADLVFAVCDDGPGITPAEQTRLFQPFERGAAAHRLRVAGSGLGLAVCKTLGEAMGGRLWVESEPGHGATFYFAVTLPLAAEAPSTAPTSAIPATHRPRSHALVVDDEEYNRITLGAYLHDLGFATTTAASGEEALTLAWQQDFHAVFLDLNLPGISGLAVARHLRSLSGHDPRRPLIATTAYATDEIRTECTEAGFSAFLTKPVSVDKIRMALAAAAALHRPAPSPQIPAGLPVSEPAPLFDFHRLAAGNGRSVEAVRALFLDELTRETEQLATAVQARDIPTTRRCAHRLAGRLGFVQATEAARIARAIDSVGADEDWEQTGANLARLTALLPALRDRLLATR